MDKITNTTAPLMYHSFDKGSDHLLSNNFRAFEFDCKGNISKFPSAKTTIIAVDAVGVLQRIREVINAPIFITSAYRPYDYNRSIGSNDHSQHPRGTAIDFTANIPIKDLHNRAIEAMDSFGITGGIGLYTKKNFIHIDVRQAPTRAEWGD